MSDEVLIRAPGTLVTGGRTRPGDGARPAIPDLLVVAAGLALAVGAAVEGWSLLERGVNIFVFFPPLLASWAPHVGPGTPVAVVIAVAVIAFGPPLSARLRWGTALASAWAAGFAWTLSLALVDGWAGGVAGRLANREEYLWDVPRVGGLGQMLAEFSDHILPTGLDPSQTWFWTTHVAGHPAGVFGVFVVLDRIGLGGGGAAAIVVLLVGTSAAAAMAVTLRALDAEDLARRALPFMVLFPGAVWVGVSADGMFAGVLAWGVALLAMAAAARGVRAGLLAVAAGVVLAFCLYLSYGLVLAGVFPLAVVVATRRWGLALPALAGGAAVVAAFTLAGFWWLEGFGKLRIVYEFSIAKDRPYAYFVYADLAAMLFALGPAVLAGLRRWAARPGALPLGAVLLVGAAVAAVVVADLSGMSKAEVERIWLPFGVWLMVACGLLPRRQVRGWLAAQALLALAVNHLLGMPW